MKIIKAASLDWATQVECSNCKTMLEVETADLLYGKFYSGMDAEVSYDFYTTCPVCNKSIFFNDKDIPQSVRYYVKSKKGETK